MSTEAIPGGGQDGGEPSVPACADGLFGEDEGTWLRRMRRNHKHLIKARADKCTAPGCSRPAADADAGHTIPWPEGPSCECNLGAPCRYHHRNKQAPGWRLEQPEPGVMKWTGPSGRVHTTYPAKYML
jgi:hypothetical protein